MYSRLRVVTFGVLLVSAFALSMMLSSHAFAATHAAKGEIDGQSQTTSYGTPSREVYFAADVNTGSQALKAYKSFVVKNTAVGRHFNLVNNNVVAKNAVVGQNVAVGYNAVAGQNVAIGQTAIIAHTINVNKTIIKNVTINNVTINKNVFVTKNVFVNRSYNVQRAWRGCCCSWCCRPCCCRPCCRWCCN